jgi:3-hydroxybutyrate dehydrogenase
VAQRLQDDGMSVLSVDLRPDPDGPGMPYEADLTDAATNEAAVNTALERFGRLDVVVANAGIQHVAPIDEFPVDKWNTIVALLLTSPFLLAKYSWPALKSSGAGRFVAIASVHGLVASPYKAAYVSSKHGVIGLCRTLALEGAEDGITANAVCPAYVRTPLVEKQIADQARAHGLPEDEVIEKVILQPHAVKELIEPSEVAGVVSFLVSPAGKMFTGAPITLDQGWTAR